MQNAKKEKINHSLNNATIVISSGQAFIDCQAAGPLLSLASAHSMATQGQLSYNPCPHPAQPGERTLPVLLVPLAGRF